MSIAPATSQPPIGGLNPPVFPDPSTTPTIPTPQILTMPPTTAEQLGPQLVGQSITDARAAAAELGTTVRVTVADGEPLAVTFDWRPSRINVAVDNDIVTAFLGMG